MISRRDFLKGAAAGALGVGVLSTIGACAATSVAAEPTAAPQTTAAVVGGAATAAPAAPAGGKRSYRAATFHASSS